MLKIFFWPTKKNQYFEPSRGGTPLRPLFFFWGFFWIFWDFFLVFFPFFFDFFFFFSFFFFLLILFICFFLSFLNIFLVFLMKFQLRLSNPMNSLWEAVELKAQSPEKFMNVSDMQVP